jgi:hypothetical protein
MAQRHGFFDLTRSLPQAYGFDKRSGRIGNNPVLKALGREAGGRREADEKRLAWRG